MNKTYFAITFLLLVGCQNNDKIIIWDYQSRSEIQDFSIIDSKGELLSQNLLYRHKLRNLEPYKYLMIKSDSFYSEEIDLYQFNRKEIDTIYFENRYHDGSRPIKYEESIADMRLKERYNILRLKREANITNLIECIRSPKQDFELNDLMLSMSIHDSGKILDYNLYSRDSMNIDVLGRKLKLHFKKCMVNQGEVIRFRTARNANVVTESLTIPIR